MPARCRRMAMLLGAFAATACSRDVPARIVIPADTLIVNSTDWTPLGVVVLDRNDVPLERARLTYSTSGTPPMEISRGGAVNCRDDGAGTIVVRVDTLEARRAIRCHLARRFARTHGMKLIAGGPPVPFEVQAFDAQDKLIPQPRFRLIIGDTTIIALRDGLVYGLKPGVASIRIRSAGHEGGQFYVVEAAPSSNDSSKAEARKR